MASGNSLLQKEGHTASSVAGGLSEENSRLPGVPGGMSFRFNGKDLINDTMTYEVVDRHVADDLVIEFGKLSFTEGPSSP
ncbi:hypothetical protein, partial [Gluconobacter sp. P1C6_b]|uniref:hypothetical protein n=1 Tax=Gluconobacter sp. P1C6_b TaxID=2762619 RepID=UPI001C05A08D